MDPPPPVGLPETTSLRTASRPGTPETTAGLDAEDDRAASSPSRSGFESSQSRQVPWWAGSPRPTSSRPPCLGVLLSTGRLRGPVPATCPPCQAPAWAAYPGRIKLRPYQAAPRARRRLGARAPVGTDPIGRRDRGVERPRSARPEWTRAVDPENEIRLSVPTHSGARSSSEMSGKRTMCGVRVSTRSTVWPSFYFDVNSRPMNGMSDSSGTRLSEVLSSRW